MFDYKVKKDQIAIRIIGQIIKKNFNNNLFNNVININNWKKNGQNCNPFIYISNKK